MPSGFLDRLTTPAVEAAQAANGSRSAYARLAGDGAADALGPEETAFIAARDSFYLATVSDSGWPTCSIAAGRRAF